MTYRSSTLGRWLRWLIWILSAAAVGAIKPLYFPEGGWKYVAVSALVLIVCAAIGLAVERSLSARE